MMERQVDVDWVDAGGHGSTVVRGSLMTLGGTWARFVVQLIALTLTARLIGPAAYGVAGVVLLVAGGAELLRTSAISVVIVQRQTISPGEASRLHRISRLLGVAAAVMLVVADCAFGGLGGLAAGMASILAVGFVMSGWAAVPTGLLIRNLRFQRLAVAEVAATVTGGSTAVIFAVLGFGAWALIGQALAIMLVQAGIAVAVCPWRPSTPAPLQAVVPMVRFSGGILTVQSANLLTRGADKVIANLRISPAAAGLYAQANQLLVLPIEQIMGPLQRISMPLLAGAARNRALLVERYSMLLRLVGIVLWPTLAVLGVLADSVVLVLFGEEWAGSAPLFQLSLLAGLAQVIGYVSSWLMVATGRSGRQVVWTLVTRPLVLGSYIVGAFWGIEGMAIAYSCVTALIVLPGFKIATHGTGVRTRHLWSGLGYPAAAGIFAAAGAMAATWLLPPSIAQIALGVVGAGIGVSVVVFASRTLRAQLNGIIRSIRGTTDGAPEASRKALHS